MSSGSVTLNHIDAEKSWKNMQGRCYSACQSVHRLIGVALHGRPRLRHRWRLYVMAMVSTGWIDSVGLSNAILRFSRDPRCR